LLVITSLVEPLREEETKNATGDNLGVEDRGDGVPNRKEDEKSDQDEEHENEGEH
jgi:hypothetical protein